MSCSAYVASLSSELVLHAKDSDTLNQLLLNGADINYQSPEGWCLLFELVSLGLEKEIAKLSSHNLDLNICDTKNRNALFWAIYHENIDVVQILIDRGINTTAYITEDLPALHYAVYKNHSGIVTKLLDEGLDIECKDCYDTTALNYAYRYNKPEMIALLLKRGAVLPS